MKIPKEVLRNFVKNENFTTTTQIMSSMKEMFSSALEEVLRCKMDDQLEFNKLERTEGASKTIGMCQETEMINSNLKFWVSTREISMDYRRKSYPYTLMGCPHETLKCKLIVL